MNRHLLPFMGGLLLCAQSYCALAATSTSSAANSTSYEQVREQLEAKRDLLSGAAQVGKATPTNVQDAPVVTDDAPSQEQQQ